MSFLVLLLSAGCRIRRKSTNQIRLTICVSYLDENLTRFTFTVAYNLGLTEVLIYKSTETA